MFWFFPLLDVGVVFLNAFKRSGAVQEGLDAQGRVVGGSHGRDVGDLVFDGGLPNVGVVVFGAAAYWKRYVRNKGP